jgi:hypothetical protein
MPYRGNSVTKCDNCEYINTLMWCSKMRIFIRTYSKRRYWSVVCSMGDGKMEDSIVYMEEKSV